MGRDEKLGAGSGGPAALLRAEGRELEANYHNRRRILTAYGIGYKLVP